MGEKICHYHYRLITKKLLFLSKPELNMKNNLKDKSKCKNLHKDAHH